MPCIINFYFSYFSFFMVLLGINDNNPEMNNKTKDSLMAGTFLVNSPAICSCGKNVN